MANEFKIKKGLIVTGASGGTVVDIQGSQGQLFSVTDDLSGSIFAVSDISGVPILDVNSSGLVTVDGPFTQTGGGDSNFSGDIILQSATPKISLIDTDAGDSFSVNNFTGNFVIKNDTDDVDPLIINGANNAIFAGDVSGVAGTFTGNLAVGNASAAEIYLNRNSANYINASNAAGYLVFRTGGTTTALTLNATGAGTFGTQAFATTATSSGDDSSTLTTKGYVDGLITGATIYRGAWDPSGGGYGSPDLSGVTQTSGYYYICSAAGTAEPNGTGTEPDTWAVGDWVIYNDVSGTGQWQKIDNSSVLSGVGTGQTVALWEGSGSVTDSETLGNAPITVSGNNTTFAGNITALTGAGSGNITVGRNANEKTIIDVGDQVNSITAYQDSDGDATHNFTLNRVFGGTGDNDFIIQKDGTAQLTLDTSANATFAGDLNISAGKKLQYSANSFMTPENNVSGAEISTAGTFIVKTGTTPTLGLTLDASQNATFAGDVTVTGTSSTFNTGNSGTFVTNDGDGYPRLTMSSSSAQLGLFRSSTAVGGMYIGADANGFRIMDASFGTKFSLSQSGAGVFSSTVTAPTFSGDLNGTINTATTGVTQTAGNNSTLIATTAYADAAAAAVPISNYLPLTGGTIDGQILISNTFPALDFVDTNSFTDVNDRFRVRAGPKPRSLYSGMMIQAQAY